MQPIPKVLQASLFKIEQSPSYNDDHSNAESNHNTSRSSTLELQIFGHLLRDGRSICIRIPDIFPYFYLDYEGGPSDPEEAKQYIQTLGNSLFDLIKSMHHSNSSCRTKIHPYGPFQLVLVKGMPFYGYHKGPKLFLKLILLQPHLKTPLINIFQQGLILSPLDEGRRPFMLFEANMTFGQQFMVDYNLFGMAPISLSQYELIMDDTKKVSHCPVEVKSRGKWIRNKLDWLQKRPIRPKSGQGVFRKDVQLLSSLEEMEKELSTQFGWIRTIDSDQLLQSIDTVDEEEESFLSTTGNDSFSMPSCRQLLDMVPFTIDLKDANAAALTNDNLLVPDQDNSLILSTPIFSRIQNLTDSEVADNILSSPSSKKLIDILEQLRKSSAEACQSSSLPEILLRSRKPEEDMEFGEASECEEHLEEEMLEAIEDDIFEGNLSLEGNQSLQDYLKTLHSDLIQLQPEFRCVASTPTTIPLDYSDSAVITELSCCSSPVANFFSVATSGREDAPIQIYEYSRTLPKLSDLSLCDNNILLTRNNPTNVKLSSSELKKLSLRVEEHYLEAPPLPLSYYQAKEWLTGTHVNGTSNIKESRSLHDDFMAAPSSGLTYMGCHLITKTSLGTTIRAQEEDSNCIVAIFLHFHNDLNGLKNTFLFDDPNEKQNIEAVSKKIRALDPDILFGHVLEEQSWGYLFDRAKTLLIPKFTHLIGRLVKTKSLPNAVLTRHQFEMPVETGYVPGRLLVNNWRLLKSEGLSDNKGYSLQAFVHTMLDARFPLYSSYSLSHWYLSSNHYLRQRAINYCFKYLFLSFQVCHSVYNRTSEFARSYGLEWSDIWNRGSQFRVESYLFRGAKLESFILASPSPQMVRQMRPMVALPLVMEPIAGYYNDPVIVLDFQSLYPSIIIAYNLCFSTALGDSKGYLGFLEGPFAPDLIPEDHNIETLRNGSRFVKRHYREGLLGRLVKEILNLRLPLKKFAKNNSATSLGTLMDHRQLALKLMASVIFGYTAAGYSGRMPCSTLADAIVDMGRFILESSIRYLAEAYPHLGVIYGDTDSLFILAPGYSVQGALQLGELLARKISKLFPDPVTLAFEKVYCPCFMLTKKKYVGHKWTTNSSFQAELDAKGIEVVRSDALPLTARMMRESLEIIFKTNSIDALEYYLSTEILRVLSGEVPFQEFILRKEFHLSSPNSLLAQLAVKANRKFLPREHVPFVITFGATKVVDRAMLLEDYIGHREKRLDLSYYLERQVLMPLQRLYKHIATPTFSIPLLIHEHIRKFGTKKTSFRLAPLIQSSFHLAAGISAVQKLCAACEHASMISIGHVSECVAADCSVLYKRICLMEQFDIK